MLKITVITPTWNQVSYIKDTIESVVNQTYQNIEYIIVDNCSDDGTQEVVRDYMSRYSYITYIREKDNGQADAINKGLKAASGDIICWINSDDFYYSNEVFANVVQKFESDDTVSVLAGDGYYCDKYGNFTEPISCDRRVADWVLTRWYYILQPAVFWRKQPDLLLDTKYHYVFDWKFFIELQSRCKFTFTREYFAVYRMYEDNKTGLDNSARKKEIYLMQKELGVSKVNTVWCRLVYRVYESAERTGKKTCRNIVNIASRILFHITGKRICSF